MAWRPRGWQEFKFSLQATSQSAIYHQGNQLVLKTWFICAYFHAIITLNWWRLWSKCQGCDICSRSYLWDHRDHITVCSSTLAVSIRWSCFCLVTFTIFKRAHCDHKSEILGSLRSSIVTIVISTLISTLAIACNWSLLTLILSFIWSRVHVLIIASAILDLWGLRANQACSSRSLRSQGSSFSRGAQG